MNGAIMDTQLLHSSDLSTLQEFHSLRIKRHHCVQSVELALMTCNEPRVLEAPRCETLRYIKTWYPPHSMLHMAESPDIPPEPDNLFQSLSLAAAFRLEGSR